MPKCWRKTLEGYRAECWCEVRFFKKDGKWTGIVIPCVDHLPWKKYPTKEAMERAANKWSAMVGG